MLAIALTPSSDVPGKDASARSIEVAAPRPILDHIQMSRRVPVQLYTERFKAV
jgi:hypothetical protein